MHDIGRESRGDWTQKSLAAGTNAAAEARRALRDFVGQTPMTDECFADLELLVSELVTNAVMHTDSAEIELRVRMGPVVRVCVIDTGEGKLELAQPAIGGWGLRLVDKLALEWGVVPLSTGKAVWFDMPTDGHEPDGST